MGYYEGTCVSKDLASSSVLSDLDMNDINTFNEDEESGILSNLNLGELSYVLGMGGDHHGELNEPLEMDYGSDDDIGLSDDSDDDDDDDDMGTTLGASPDLLLFFNERGMFLDSESPSKEVVAPADVQENNASNYLRRSQATKPR